MYFPHIKVSKTLIIGEIYMYIVVILYSSSSAMDVIILMYILFILVCSMFSQTQRICFAHFYLCSYMILSVRHKIALR